MESCSTEASHLERLIYNNTMCNDDLVAWLFIIRKYGGLVLLAGSRLETRITEKRRSFAACRFPHTHAHVHANTQTTEAPRKRMISSWLIFSIEVDLCMSDATPPSPPQLHSSTARQITSRSDAHTHKHSRRLSLYIRCCPQDCFRPALHMDSHTLNI